MNFYARTLLCDYHPDADEERSQAPHSLLPIPQQPQRTNTTSKPEVRDRPPLTLHLGGVHLRRETPDTQRSCRGCPSKCPELGAQMLAELGVEDRKIPLLSDPSSKSKNQKVSQQMTLT